MTRLPLSLSDRISRSSRGFTLIEIAVSLFILTLVLGVLLAPLATQTEERQAKEAERAMTEMLEALVGFALSQATPRLPCPDRTSGGAGTVNDTANDGIEDFNSGTGICAVEDGNLPWVTLGVTPSDPWGNRYRYLATSAFTNRSPATTMALSSAGNIKVCAGAPSNAVCTVGGVANSYVADNVPAAIVSHGKNGFGAMNSSSNVQISATDASTHEAENAGGTYPYSLVSRVRTDSGSGAFDDIVIWLSPNVLFSRLVAANKLP
ncbi:MAG: type II secretion system protein [Betaproteobacteria bacterium]|jgi:prepilin-type N-terminal cleavage/methylation domain-containing protein